MGSRELTFGDPDTSLDILSFKYQSYMIHKLECKFIGLHAYVLDAERRSRFHLDAHFDRREIPDLNQQVWELYAEYCNQINLVEPLFFLTWVVHNHELAKHVGVPASDLRRLTALELALEHMWSPDILVEHEVDGSSLLRLEPSASPKRGYGSNLSSDSSPAHTPREHSSDDEAMAAQRLEALTLEDEFVQWSDEYDNQERLWEHEDLASEEEETDAQANPFKKKRKVVLFDVNQYIDPNNQMLVAQLGHGVYHAQYLDNSRASENFFSINPVREDLQALNQEMLNRWYKAGNVYQLLHAVYFFRESNKKWWSRAIEYYDENQPAVFAQNLQLAITFAKKLFLNTFLVYFSDPQRQFGRNLQKNPFFTFRSHSNFETLDFVKSASKSKLNSLTKKNKSMADEAAEWKLTAYYSLAALAYEVEGPEEPDAIKDALMDRYNHNKKEMYADKTLPTASYYTFGVERLAPLSKIIIDSRREASELYDLLSASAFFYAVLLNLKSEKQSTTAKTYGKLMNQDLDYQPVGKGLDVLIPPIESSGQAFSVLPVLGGLLRGGQNIIGDLANGIESFNGVSGDWKQTKTQTRSLLKGEDMPNNEQYLGPSGDEPAPVEGWGDGQNQPLDLPQNRSLLQPGYGPQGSYAQPRNYVQQGNYAQPRNYVQPGYGPPRSYIPQRYYAPGMVKHEPRHLANPLKNNKFLQLWKERGLPAPTLSKLGRGRVLLVPTNPLLDSRVQGEVSTEFLMNHLVHKKSATDPHCPLVTESLGQEFYPEQFAALSPETKLDLIYCTQFPWNAKSPLVVITHYPNAFA